MLAPRVPNELIQIKSHRLGSVRCAMMAPAFHRATTMNDSQYLALQASVICVLFFILGNAALIEHPEWFR